MLAFLLLSVAATLVVLIVGVVVVVIQQRCKFQRLRREEEGAQKSGITIGIYHPRCFAGGGGERVLWKAVESLSRMDGFPISKIVIYTADPPSPTYRQDILQHARDRFSIDVSSSQSTIPLEFVHLHEEFQCQSEQPPAKRFTMIAESAGTMWMAYKALEKFTPHVWMDTTGCAFTFLVAKILARCRIVAYVHYPTISTDMLSLVWERRPTYNNDEQVASSTITTYIKLVYYTIFAVAYGFVGSLSDLAMVNSTWTRRHIESLWRLAPKITTVYPPCDVLDLAKLPLENRQGHVILSVGQFRPEKDHALQLRALAALRQHKHASRIQQARLVLVGSCRGAADEARVQELRRLAQELQVASQVDFVVNQPYKVLREQYFAQAHVGIHTMWNEHFGIGIVEMMAAGLVMIAHRSGGPQSDILAASASSSTPCGFLATTPEEYANALYDALCDGPNASRILSIRRAGREQSAKFSDQVFDESFRKAMATTACLWKRP